MYDFNGCPVHDNGRPGHDALCEECLFEYGGTHYREEEPIDYLRWCLEERAKIKRGVFTLLDSPRQKSHRGARVVLIAKWEGHFIGIAPHTWELGVYVDTGVLDKVELQMEGELRYTLRVLDSTVVLRWAAEELEQNGEYCGCKICKPQAARIFLSRAP